LTGEIQWGIRQIGRRGREREREREQQIEGERERRLVGKSFGVGLEMTVSEMEHLVFLSI